MRAHLRWPAVIIASAVILVAVTILDVAGPIRAVVALWFLLVCMGMAFLPLAGIRPSTPLELALIPLFSIVLDSLTATCLTLLGAFSQASALVALIGLAVVGCVLQLRATRTPKTSEPREKRRSPAAASAYACSRARIAEATRREPSSSTS